MTGKMLGSGLGVIGMLMTIIWALGTGMGVTQAMFRGLIALVAMFLVGLMLGKAMSEAVSEKGASEEKTEKKEEVSKKGP